MSARLALQRSGAAAFRSAGFQTCCIAGLPACGRARRPDVTGSCDASADWEIGDIAGLETCATSSRACLLLCIPPSLQQPGPKTNLRRRLCSISSTKFKSVLNQRADRETVQLGPALQKTQFD